MDTFEIPDSPDLVRMIYRHLNKFTKVRIKYLKTEYESETVDIEQKIQHTKEVQIRLEKLHLADLWLDPRKYNWQTNCYRDNTYFLTFL